MGVDRRQRGNDVEAAARAELERAGLQLIAANVTYRGGELDLVMQQAQCLVFVEVRYRRNDAFGGGAASIDRRKRRRLVVAAQLFLAAHPHYANWPCRFDVVEAEGEPPPLTWLRDAFRADDC
ncbi:YraN family protein [Xanthomonas translucens pv. graminis]|uniref:YraN family protein n=1 Tax=Xanthomonas graminis TaxID=3390026 RepID=UPI002541B5FD|nr:YraN family protein [Xanthomonas translucens]WIH04370.1 YraN family protein [Xanthomonas translucens pv. graminis]